MKPAPPRDENETQTELSRAVAVREVRGSAGLFGEDVVVFRGAREAERAPDVDRGAGRVSPSVLDQARFPGRVQRALCGTTGKLYKKITGI